MLNYIPSPTGLQFHESDAYIKMIWGPFGSGKSTVCPKDIQIYGCAQTPDERGIRYTKWGVIRNSYTQLVSTTRDSITSVMPDASGQITQSKSPLSGVFKVPLNDGTIAQMEFELWAVETALDLEKFKSANWTGAWLNEADQLPEGTIEFVMSRVGRFPGQDFGGCRWSGILMDFNRPPAGHYLWSLMEAGYLEFDGSRFDIDVFKQPPAAFREVDSEGEVYFRANPEAENLANLKGGMDFYKVQIAAHLNKGEIDLIENRFCLLDTTVHTGKAVFPKFRKEVHVAKRDIQPVAKAPVIGGFDSSGLHPAVVLFQMIQSKWCCVDELYGEDMSLEDFFQGALLPLLQSKYGGCPVIISCDPANARNQLTGRTPVSILREDYGIRAETPVTNSPAMRIQTTAGMLNRDSGGLLFSPHCRLSIKAMSGDYHYKQLKIYGSVEVQYSRTPVKNSSSHIADAIQYFALYVERTTESERLINPALYSKMSKIRRQRRKIV